MSLFIFFGLTLTNLQAQIIEKNCYKKAKIYAGCDPESNIDKQCIMLFYLPNNKDQYVTRNVVPMGYSKLIGEVINKHTTKNDFCLYGDRNGGGTSNYLTFYAIRAGKFCHEWAVGDCKSLYKKMKNKSTLNVGDL